VQSEKLVGLGQMVAGVAHEINNPLAFVTNNVAVLQRDVKSIADLLQLYRGADAVVAAHQPQLMAEVNALAERVDLAYTMQNLNELLTRSRDGLKRIQQIVKDLRDFARLDESDLSEVDLNAGVESTVNIILGHAKRKRVTVEKKLGPLPRVCCYPAKVNQVVMNLLSNAIDASHEGGTVTITTASAPAQSGKPPGVRIEVTDGGTGIEPDVRQRIFDPFFTTKPTGKGTGLGLSISYGIVQDHGGTIEVESTVGQGSTFRVILPLAGPKK
jgi:signal transduction histidine kinase